MKKCHKCNFENTDLMNFCLECGSPLGNSLSTEQATALFTGTVPTNSSVSRETQTVVTNFNQPPETKTIVSYQTPLVSKFQTPPPPKNNTKMFLILGGILALLVLGGIAVGGIGLAVYYSQKDVTPKPTPTPIPTPFPTRTIVQISPTPIRSATPISTPPVPQGSEPSADFVDMRVDVNVKEGGQLGMRSYITFTTKNMKGVDSYLAIYFQKNDGTPLSGKMTAYRSKTGQVAVFKLLRPAYDPADYKDLDLFIPYTAFGLPPGKYDLQMDVNLIYKTDGLIKQLNVYDFKFEQR